MHREMVKGFHHLTKKRSYVALRKLPWSVTQQQMISTKTNFKQQFAQAKYLLTQALYKLSVGADRKQTRSEFQIGRSQFSQIVSVMLSVPPLHQAVCIYPGSVKERPGHSSSSSSYNSHMRFSHGNVPSRGLFENIIQSPPFRTSEQATLCSGLLVPWAPGAAAV